MKLDILTPEFVTLMPDDLVPGVIYISREYGVALHLCACGCGNEVVTLFGRSGWELVENDGVVTLKPSIGNFSFPCRSHYYIRGNRVVWCR